MKKLYLLDAYALIYRAYYALIRAPRINSRGENTSAIYGFVNTLHEILTKEQPTHLGVAFDPHGPTFRHERYPEYKAQREATPEDIQRSVPIIKDIIRAHNIPILEVPGYEADDVIGTLARKAEAAGFETFMVTPDKDYGQLVSEHVTQLKLLSGGNKEAWGPREVGEKFGIPGPEYVIDILGLMGDKVDNVPGCPGVGEKTAASLVSQFGHIEQIYEHIDEVKGKLRDKLIDNREQTLFSKFLVTIHRDVPIDLDEAQLAVKEADREALLQIYQEQEFQSFIRRLGGELAAAKPQAKATEKTSAQPSAPRPKPAVEQLDLFAEFAGDSSDAPNDAILEQPKIAPVDYERIEDETRRAWILEQICAEKNFSFSLSTTSQRPMNAEIIGFAVVLSPGRGGFVSTETGDATPAQILQEFKPVFESDAIDKTGHDLKFAAIALSRYGITLRGPMFDTMLAHYVIQPELKHHMPYLASIYLNYPDLATIPETYFGTKWMDERNERLLPPEVQTRFHGTLADAALHLRPMLESEMAQADATALYRDIELPLVDVLKQIEVNGARIDTVALSDTAALFDQRLRSYEQEIFQLAGHSFNLLSPRQVGDVLFGELKLMDKPKRTKSGQYVTTEEVLNSLKGRAPIVAKLLTYRQLSKLQNTYITALPQLINTETGRIHSSFNQAVTATGRLSSSNPNLQNIPVRGDDGKEIRKVFIPEPGCLFFSADYSQIELRIMAHLSGDEHLIEAFLNGQDIHAATAARIFHKDIAEVSDQERRRAKTANFGIIYGITAFGLAQRMGVPRQEAKELIESYFETFPQVRRYIDDSVEKARQLGYTETICRRRRYLPDILSHNATVRGLAERNAINAPIQGSAADIIKIAMLRVHDRMQREGLRSKLILQVHDELNFSVLPDEKEAMERLVRQEMEAAYPMRAPLVVDCGWGENWLEAH